MTIAQFQRDLIGARIYYPEGPFGSMGNDPRPGFGIGSSAHGPGEGEWVYVRLALLVATTIKQGDLLMWDNSFTATLAVSNATAPGYPVGMKVGTVFFGGRVGDPAAHPNPGNVWSATLSAGIYGVWAQVRGCSLLNVGTVTSQATAPVTTSTAGLVGFTGAAAGGAQVITGVSVMPVAFTFTATTVVGSSTLSAVSTNVGLVTGMNITGTGIPNGTVIKSIDGATVVISKVATAAGSGVTMTCTNGKASAATTVNLSAILSNVSTLVGFYPNQTITGTGIPASTLISSMESKGGVNTITMSKAATASATIADLTAAQAANYSEAMLNYPTITGVST